MLPQPLKIGPLVVDPPVLQAPMAGFTGYGYREILRRLGGVGLLATEMVSARAVLEMESRGSGPPERLWRVAEEGRPLAVQIWDNDPGLLAQVGRRLAQRVRPSAVDINFGCPIRNVSEKAQSGSYLLRYPDRVGEIVGRVVEACAPTPVTAKIRLGWTRETINAVEVAQAVEAAGGAAVTVHGRTAAQRFRGSADWEQIAAIKPHLRRIPLIGNGDLSTTESVVEAFRRWGVDGVMIGRAGLSKPWLFRQAAAALGGSAIPPDPTPVEQRELLLEHYRLVVEQFGRTKGTILMRRCACRYARGTAGAKEFRAEVCRVSTPEEFVEVVGRFFAADAGAC